MCKQNNFKVSVFESLPIGLKDSDYVDLLLFLLGLKPCVRLGNNTKNMHIKMKKWCEANNFRFTVNAEQYMYVSCSNIMTNITKCIDDSVLPHAYILGRLLGYPSCCCRKISRIGENNIDDWERELCEKNIFVDKFKVINPEGYLEGYSLISHIPCSSDCEKSLKIAQKVMNVISENQDNECFLKWKKWVLQ